MSKPASVFHPSEFLVEEASAREMTIWDVADFMGGDPETNVLALQLYSLRDPDGRLGELARGLERALGVSAHWWQALEALWVQAAPDARDVGMSYEDLSEWYEVSP